MRHLFVVVPLALMIIFGLLYLTFGEMRYAFLILLNLPFALSGGIFILLGARGCICPYRPASVSSPSSESPSSTGSCSCPT